MSNRYYGSICLSDLIDLAKGKHSAFSRAKNKKVYANVIVWINDKPDKYDNIASIQLSSNMEKAKQEGKVFIGNLKAGGKKKSNSNGSGEDNFPF